MGKASQVFKYGLKRSTVLQTITSSAEGTKKGTTAEENKEDVVPILVEGTKKGTNGSKVSTAEENKENVVPIRFSPLVRSPPGIPRLSSMCGFLPQVPNNNEKALPGDNNEKAFVRSSCTMCGFYPCILGDFVDETMEEYQNLRCSGGTKSLCREQLSAYLSTLIHTSGKSMTREIKDCIADKASFYFSDSDSGGEGGSDNDSGSESDSE